MRSRSLIRLLPLLLLTLGSAREVAAQACLSTQGSQEFCNALTAGVRFGFPRYTTAALPTCNTSNKGAVAFDTTAGSYKGCDGSTWAVIGFTGGAITSPILAPAADDCANVPYSFTGDTTTGVCSRLGSGVSIYNAGSEAMLVYLGDTYFKGSLNLSSTGNIAAANVRLYPEAANTLALRNSTNAQTFNWYYSYTDASNYHRGALKTSATGIEIAAETAGSGADNLDITLTPAGTGGVKVTSGAGLSVGGAAIIADYFSAPTGTGYYIGSRGFLQGGDAAGELAAVSSSGSANATWRFSRQIEVNTTTKAPGALENGEIYTNTGDGDGSTVTLLNDPAIGSQYCVIVDAAQTVTVAPSTGETIVQAGTAYSTSCTNNVPGSTACFVAGTGGSGARWFFLSVVGTWTCS